MFALHYPQINIILEALVDVTGKKKQGLNVGKMTFPKAMTELLSNFANY